MSLSRAIEGLPESYGLLAVIDLVKNIRLLALLSLASIALFFLFGWGVIWFLQIIRPGITEIGFDLNISVDSLGSIPLIILTILGTIFVMVVFHEAVHGIFFKIITGGKIKFGFKGAYAYAAAPDWLIPKVPYMVISLAPFVIISLACVLAVIWLPAGWILPVFLLVTMNGSGSVGDLYVFFWLLTKPRDLLIQDFGERMKVYAPGVESEQDDCPPG